MTYTTIAQIAVDPDLWPRVIACAATQPFGAYNPASWVTQRQWQLSASPGWADAYAAAVSSNTPNPGASPTVITDAMILTAVQAAN